VTRFTLLGVPIDPLTEGEAVDWVARAIVEGHPRLVISVNPERIMHAGRDLAFGAVLRSADLALADGVGVVWAARRLGRPLPERVVGVDFVKALAARGRAGLAVLLPRWRSRGGGGGRPGAAGGVLRLHPGRKHAGSPDPASDAATIEAVRSSGAQLLFLAYGAGAEEAWLARNPGSPLDAELGAGVAAPLEP
jgi:N-acetylglucosaminyldiphosphoundecaprenol N-acetyl-beta-D-mannosaminyltransferase